MRLHKLVCAWGLAFCLSVLCSLASAQSAQQPAQPAPESILIGPGDVLHVQVFDTPSLDETARVNDDGSFPLILGGTIQAGSKTTEQAARLIEENLVRTQIMYHPRVLVTVVQYGTQNVTVFGQVARPGSYPINTPRSILDVIAIAGGTTDLANRTVTVQRHTGGEVHYFISNNADTAVQDSVLVYPGDRIIVPRASISYVLGDVQRPGGFPSISNDSKLTVLQAVAQAGGTLSSAVPNDSKLIRRKEDGGYTVIKLKISDMQKGKRPDMLLEANDVVYIPFSYVRNALSLGIPGILSAATSAAIYTH